jgi:phosphoribosyl 1,2-cyclic phosphodiesterase
MRPTAVRAVSVIRGAEMKDRQLSGVPSDNPGHGLTLCVLASGSRGNATYISNGLTAILLDAGLSGKELQRRMAAKGLDPDSLDAILVSHEHTDHIHGVGVMARRFGLTVHISDGTWQASRQALGKLTDVRPFACGHAFSIGDFAVHPFSISHDAADPAGFTLACNGFKVGVATDLGIATGVVKTHLQDCNALILEANHDPQMLIDGSYPWPLKQRIRGRSGHLSNDDAASLLEALTHERLSHVILAHLSEENNTPDKAKQTLASAINSRRTTLHIATQSAGTRVLRLY